MLNISKMGRLEKIWNDFINSEEYGAIPELEEVTKDREKAHNLLEAAVQDRDAFVEIADAIATFGTSNERAGFEEGFKYAFQMCVELFSEGTKINAKK